jgi:hypothetical protein
VRGDVLMIRMAALGAVSTKVALTKRGWSRICRTMYMDNHTPQRPIEPLGIIPHCKKASRDRSH